MGQTFQWVAENALGYAGYVVASISEESGSSDSHNNLVNKRALQKYISHYPEGRYAIQVKLEARSSKSQSQLATATPTTSSQPSASSQAVIDSQLSSSSRISSVPTSSLPTSQQTLDKSVKKLLSPPKYATIKGILCNMEL